MIQDIFPDVDILSSTPPDEVIAVGAAQQAALLVSRDGPELEQESTTVEVSASDIMVKVKVKVYTVHSRSFTTLYFFHTFFLLTEMICTKKCTHHILVMYVYGSNCYNGLSCVKFCGETSQFCCSNNT